jgi:N-acetylglutamate synthase-like GNAT family acetyltransferase
VTVVEPTSDTALAAELCGIVNRAYAVGERGLWLADVERMRPEEVADAIRRGEALVARVDGEIVGYARLRRLDERLADLGPIAIDPDRWGSGAGGALIRFAEARAREAGAAAMQLDVLMPKAGAHEHKETLRAWYERLGFALVEHVPFERIATHAAAQLAVPCHFAIFRKDL